jgi:hypothetical protein
MHIQQAFFSKKGESGPDFGRRLLCSVALSQREY